MIRSGGDINAARAVRASVPFYGLVADPNLDMTGGGVAGASGVGENVAGLEARHRKFLAVGRNFSPLLGTVHIGHLGTDADFWEVGIDSSVIHYGADELSAVAKRETADGLLGKFTSDSEGV